MKQIVIMPGGFHPFHAGHYALYQSALQQFPDADVYVAATNDQSERPFPFNLKEKLAKLAGVAPGRFVQVKSPFQAKEITSNYNPDEDVLIFVRSEKDRNEAPQPGGTKKDGSPAYFQPYTGKDLQPFSKHAYMAYLPTVTFGPGIKSATEIRKAWPTLNDKRKTALVMSLYPAAQKNPKLAQTVVGMFDQVMSAQDVTESQLDETIRQDATKLLKAIGWAGKKGLQGLWWGINNPGKALTAAAAITHPREFYYAGNFAWNLLTDPVNTAKIIAKYGWDTAKPWGNAREAEAGLMALMGKSTTSDFIFGLAEFVVRNAIPIAGVIALLYGGKKFMDYIKQKEDKQPGKQVFDRIRSDLENKSDQQGVAEDKETSPVANAVINFYKPVIADVQKEKVPDYVDQARELLSKTDDPTIRRKVLDILKKGKENPYLQGGIITTVGALLAGGVLNSAQSMGLNPQQTNLALQGILNTVIPTLVSRINGKNWKDTIKYTLASAGVGVGIAAITESENLDYLEEK